MSDCPFCEDDDADEVEVDEEYEEEECDHLVTEWINDPEFFLGDSEGIITWYECDDLVEAVKRLYATWRTVRNALDAGDSEGDTYALIRSRIEDSSGWLDGLVKWGSPSAFLTAYGVIERAITRVPGVEVVDSEVGGCGTSTEVTSVYSQDPDAPEAIGRSLCETAAEIDRFETELAALCSLQNPSPHIENPSDE
jgi:hypothetical protein